MKSISAADACADFNAVIDAAQREQILVIRNGKPCLQIIGIEDFYDEEDMELMRDKEFWKMIAERRRDTSPGIPLEEMKRRLGLEKSNRKATPKKGGKKRKASSR